MTILDESRTAHDETAREETTRTEPTPARRRLAITPVTALTALVALAAVAALFFGGRWALALTDDGLELAAQREAVLVDARQAAINLNTLDYRDVAAGLDLW